MNAVQWSKELCQILINNGAEVNAQDSSGNTALHCAINSVCWDREDIVQFLIDHGSDPYMKNKYGDDAFQSASLAYLESINILNKLFLQYQPPVRHRIESYELLGAHRGNIDPSDIQEALQFWKTAVEMRRINACVEVNALQPNPVYLFAQEVNTVEELETLSQNHDLVFMHALMIFERILGPGHIRVQSELLHRDEMYKHEGEFQRCFDILRYAFQLQIDRVEKLTSRYLRILYISPLYQLCSVFTKVFKKYHQSINRSYFRVKCQEVLEILQMASSKVDDATGIVISQEFQNDEHEQLGFMK